MFLINRTKKMKSMSSLVKITLKSIILFTSSLFFLSCSSEESQDIGDPVIIVPGCEPILAETLGYNAFVRYGVHLTSGDSEGPLAMGGDLTLNGLFTAAAHTAGTFYYDNESEASSLVVNGKINYITNEGVHLNNGYVKIGDLSGSITHDVDNNNAISNTRITQGSYNDQPRIHVQRHQKANTVNISNIIDFETAFEKLIFNSTNYSRLSNTIELENGNKITLRDNSVNVLNLTGEELNSLIDFTFNNKPTKTSPLIININQEGDFVWNVQNQAGLGDQDGAYIVFNFYNSSSIILNDGGATVTGTILAPTSHVIKKTSGNINGQLIAASYNHLRGELHQHVFAAETCGGATDPVPQGFSK